MRDGKDPTTIKILWEVAVSRETPTPTNMCQERGLSPPNNAEEWEEAGESRNKTQGLCGGTFGGQNFDKGDIKLTVSLLLMPLSHHQIQQKP